MRYPRPENYSNQRPRIYVRIGNAIEVFPIPDATYDTRIVYPQWPTPFSTATQTSDYDSKDQLLVVATIMETYLVLEEYQDAAVWYNKMLGMLMDAVKAEGDVDWEPQAEPINMYNMGEFSGTPWAEPGAVYEDPLYGYPDQ